MLRAIAFLVFCLTLLAEAVLSAAAPKIDFNRDIRPILSDHCFACHGPDEARRSAGLRLDTREGLFTEREGAVPVEPGDPKASGLTLRIESDDPAEQMPPPKFGRPLSANQRQMIAEWIRQGANWSQHWAFVPPVRQDPPVLPNDTWSRDPIDRFVLARLREEGLSPSPEADRVTWLRRVALDLTGLPPTVPEVDAFLADQSPAAREKVVDKLLASPRYGEHLAAAWLDAARYADTSGYQNDGPRDMWRWRDWVIDAFNSNQPFDRFTVEQLAGDLVPNPTLATRIATGFNRNHRGNAEGGIIPEEYQVEYVADRVETTATVWLGLTLGCARCHDHKYDPISQREFYRVFAYFNNIPENGRAIKEGNSPPYIAAPLPEQAARLRELDSRIEAAEARVASGRERLSALQAAWERDNPAPPSSDWSLADGLVRHFPFDASAADSAGGAVATLEGTSPIYEAGAVGAATVLDGKAIWNAGDTADFGYFDKFTLSAWIRPDALDGTILSRMTPVDDGAGYALHLQDGRVQLNLVKRWLDDSLRVETRDPIPAKSWTHIVATYDGSRVANGVKIYVDGVAAPLKVNLDKLNQTFSVKTEPLRVGGGALPFRGAIDDVRIYRRDLGADEAALLAVRPSIAEILKQPTGERSPASAAKLARWFLEMQAPADFRDADRELTQLLRERRAFRESLPTVMVMEEMPQPRATHVLTRGQYDHPAERVSPGVPAIFPALATDAPPHRLALANWLVSADHPLTARVAVNRFWQRLFGIGLVKTVEDFGVQGEPPSHPELLDWLATEFIASGWNVKALHKRIVLSATYGQASTVSPELTRRDPDNRLLARGPRRRLSAEIVRDQALAASGLIKERVGGPSVKPYQPDGLWKEIATDTDYVQSHGDDLYRRSLYTYWKRTVAPPTMMVLDAAGREACIVQRSTTNTPLQALALWNDPTFVEAARVLAGRLLSRADASDETRLRELFRSVLLRQPREEELVVLSRRLTKSRERFRDDADSARRLIAVGEFPVDPKLDVVEWAALTTVASLVLNLDETMTKE